MSAVWTWLASSVSDPLAGGDTLRLAVGTVALAVGLVLVCAFVAVRRRRRRGQTHARQFAQAARQDVPAAVAPAAPPTTFISVPEFKVPSAQLLPAPDTTTPTHAASGSSWREGGEWHAISGPLASVRIATPVSAPLAPAGAVAVAERPSRPLPASAAAELLDAPPVDAPAATPESTPLESDLEARARDDYRRGLELLAQADADRVQALYEALACFRRAQEIWTRERAPERWAAVQNDTGRVYQEMPDGDRAAHVRAAILHHQSALEVFDPQQHPMNWAWTQSALGAAYQCLPTGSAIANARAAVAYHQRALDVFTRENAPLAWAWNQNNLAAAYEMMRGGADGERVAHLRDAVQCYEAALEVYTVQAHPIQHQVITRNLARVQSELKALE
jgi:hypothetical protein